MKIQKIKSSYGCELLAMDGYDDCIEGVGTRANQIPFIVYNYEKVINKLMNQGMTYHEAIDFHEFNQASAWVGESTPVFLYKYD
jgi:hypothetical protein